MRIMRVMRVARLSCLAILMCAATAAFNPRPAFASQRMYSASRDPAAALSAPVSDPRTTPATPTTSATTATPVVPASGGRNIYIGDIISLEIESDGISAEQLRQAFSDFDIVDLITKNGVTKISLRSFEPGEYRALIGDRELIITVSSTLDDISVSDVFDGEAVVMPPGFPFHWRVFFYCACALCASSAAYAALMFLREKRRKALTPYQLLLLRLGTLSADDEGYLVELTRFLKEYLGALYKRRIIGKTSSEIINELMQTPLPDTMLPDIEAWLRECDSMKFSGLAARAGQKKEHGDVNAFSLQ